MLIPLRCLRSNRPLTLPRCHIAAYTRAIPSALRVCACELCSTLRTRGPSNSFRLACSSVICDPLNVAFLALDQSPIPLRYQPRRMRAQILPTGGA